MTKEQIAQDANEATIGAVASTAMLGGLTWNETTHCEGEDTLYTAHLADGGRITVLHRKTGYEGGWFDTESGYRDADGKFWLASGNRDVRDNADFTVQQSIDWVKAHANTCVAA